MCQADQGVSLVVAKSLENSLDEPVEPEHILAHHTNHIMVTGMETANVIFNFLLLVIIFYFMEPFLTLSVLKGGGGYSAPPSSFFFNNSKSNQDNLFIFSEF